MEMNPILLDALRAAHLTLFAAGMGTVLFHDYLTFRGLRMPICEGDIKSIEQLHAWIFWAFMGLWATGLVLIYVRTGFDLSAFSPKLWMKVSLMVLMTLNGTIIRALVLPLLRRNIGRSMSSLPRRDLAVASQVAIFSMFGWSSGLFLGSSTYLKTAPWEVLLPAAAIWFGICTIGGQLAVLFIRALTKGEISGAGASGA
ncbi:hypothetical protein [uncultured Sulfitobacter sp.]|uniref:hypothetical protein n=1 Tax=uncultured Sulfitobacter sp. TaxID=191468 RepID=UPI002629C0AF|nr:hypothetical protein [uncultured Sulfitobacter sp.]